MTWIHCYKIAIFFTVNMENIIFNKHQECESSNYKDYTQDLFLAPEPKKSNDQHNSSDLFGKKKKDKSKKQIEAEEREKMRYEPARKGNLEDNFSLKN